mmetsp:Transcript_11243/g.31331  ORF Transcript_11243/g.31331 Transcript_11243/m.31331 type:complete len:263 (-) Transcript_11243:164-952(-)
MLSLNLRSMAHLVRSTGSPGTIPIDGFKLPVALGSCSISSLPKCFVAKYVVDSFGTRPRISSFPSSRQCKQWDAAFMPNRSTKTTPFSSLCSLLLRMRSLLSGDRSFEPVPIIKLFLSCWEIALVQDEMATRLSISKSPSTTFSFGSTGEQHRLSSALAIDLRSGLRATQAKSLLCDSLTFWLKPFFLPSKRSADSFVALILLRCLIPLETSSSIWSLLWKTWYGRLKVELRSCRMLFVDRLSLLASGFVSLSITPLSPAIA